MRVALPCLLIILGCTSFSDEAHRKIASAFDCPQVQVAIEKRPDGRYDAKGCGYAAVYTCKRKAHQRAGGATYVVCTKSSDAD